MSNGFWTNANADNSYERMAEASEVFADNTTISASGVRFLMRRMTSKPDSAPSTRSTSATSNARWSSAALTAAREVAHSARNPRASAASSSIRASDSSSSTIRREMGRIGIAASCGKSRAEPAHAVRFTPRG